jgi:hypothetical protein
VREEGAVKSHHDQGYCRWQKAFMEGRKGRGREGRGRGMYCGGLIGQ